MLQILMYKIINFPNGVVSVCDWWNMIDVCIETSNG